MRRTLTTAILIAQLAVLSAVNGAGATPPTPASGTVFPARAALEYEWKAGSEPPTWLRGAINSAARSAGAESGAGTPTFTYRDGAPSAVSYTGNIPTGYAIGYATSNAPKSFSIRLRPQGYVLDWGTLRWCQFYQSPPTGCYDAEMITLHEFGHVLTLDHVNEADVTNWTDTIMHVSPKTKAKAGWNAHQFGRCDVARLQLRYELKSAATRVSTCLSLGSALTLASSRSSPVASGSSLTMTADLSIDLSAGQGSLAGDPLAGRTVWLQRRAVGANGWNDYLLLTSQSTTSGRYARSFSVTATYDYRARFAAPANEGVGGSTSAIVRIAISDPCVNYGVKQSTTNAPTC